jgi:hypothetical protein
VALDGGCADGELFGEGFGGLLFGVVLFGGLLLGWLLLIWLLLRLLLLRLLLLGGSHVGTVLTVEKTRYGLALIFLFIDLR